MIDVRLKHLIFEQERERDSKISFEKLLQQANKQTELWQEYAKALEELKRMRESLTWCIDRKTIITEKAFLLNLISLQLKIESLQTDIRNNCKLLVDSGITIELEEKVVIK